VTVAEPIVGSVLGVTVLGETLQTSNVGLVALGLSVAVMAAAAVALAHSQATSAGSGDEKPTHTRKTI
jgi:hypothetical protein